MTEQQPQRLQNLYIARLTTQERPCFVCSKFTSVVLTSADNSNADWFYICRAHLGDFNFCSKIGASSPKQAPKSPTKKEFLADRPVESDSVVDLVSSIGSAWKSWRGPKKEEDKKEDKVEEKKEDKVKEKEEKMEKSTPTTPITTSPPPTSPTTSTQPVRFVIQRDYFYLRQREFLKKAQKKEANEKLKILKFPEVPKTMPTLK